MEMELKFLSKAIFFFLLLSVLSSFSSSSVISACPVNFEFMNYTIITSRCKAPKYPAKKCCDAFKAFACPYADYLNDQSTDCASTMFSYIHLYGKYPPGLFSHKCKGGKEGLKCATTTASSGRLHSP